MFDSFTPSVIIESEWEMEPEIHQPHFDIDALYASTEEYIPTDEEPEAEMVPDFELSVDFVDIHDDDHGVLADSSEDEFMDVTEANSMSFDSGYDGDDEE